MRAAFLFILYFDSRVQSNRVMHVNAHDNNCDDK